MSEFACSSVRVSVEGDVVLAVEEGSYHVVTEISLFLQSYVAHSAFRAG